MLLRLCSTAQATPHTEKQRAWKPLAAERGTDQLRLLALPLDALSVAGRRDWCCTMAVKAPPSRFSSSSSSSLFSRFLARVGSCLNGILRVGKLSSSSSSSSSSSPCGVNRWLALAIYVVILFLSAQTFGGWARGFREMLFRSGAYEWRCGSELEPAPYPDGPVCESQKIAVDNLWTVAYVSRAVGACPAGTILDLLGPKLTSLLGAGLVAVGWVLLAVSGPGFEGYIPALLLIAGAGEILALPLVTVANLFPKYEPLVLSICGAAKSSSAAVPVIMYSIWRAAGAQGMDLQGIAFAYAFGVVGALALIILLLVPYRRFGWVSAYPVGAELVESAGGDLSEKKMAGARSGPPSSSSTVPPSDLAPLSDDSKSTSLDIAPP
eukprot:GHVT01030784.1.p1 GENE.GHVT01030784.1~~GHVT01030784.1.p1  ORF type:complete len:380 (-),score=77.22 GHVT01030784.1:1460-2599(-)